MIRTTLATLTVAFALLAAAAPAAKADDRHVLVISIDGLPAYMFDDPRAVMPTLRQLAAEGAVATRGMQVSNPSVTWPTHTSMVSGVYSRTHSVLFNGLLIRGESPGDPVQVDPRRDRAELVAARTIYDAAHEAGLSTAEVNWPGTRNADTIDHGFPDTPEVFQHITPTLRTELIEAGIIEADTERWDWRTTSAASRDDIYTQVAEHVIRRHRPRLMLFHLLNVDGTHHSYGAQTRASYGAVAYADTCVRRVLDALEDAGIRDRTTIFIVADHGFKTAEKALQPNVMLRDAGLLNVEGNQVTGGRAQAVTIGGAAFIYLLNEETRKQDREAALELFSDAEGVATILKPDDYHEHHLPHPDENDRMADLVLEAAPGYAFGRAVHTENAIVNTGPRGYHGYLARRERMNAIFIASGSGVRNGIEIEQTRIIDLAPTIANLLNLDLPTAEGDPIEAILTTP